MSSEEGKIKANVNIYYFFEHIKLALTPLVCSIDKTLTKNRKKTIRKNQLYDLLQYKQVEICTPNFPYGFCK